MSNQEPPAQDLSKISVSVIMPVYNGKDFIARSLPPLVKMMKSGEIVEVIVVDDSSTDNTAELAMEMGARVMPSGGRLGPGAARNMAATDAKGDILWFVDADVIVHEDAAEQLKKGFIEPDVVSVFGSYDDKPPARNFLSQYKNLVHHYYHHQASRDASTFWAGCGAIRKDAFLYVGGFDIETYKRPSIEDIELGYRLIEAGGRILLLPELLSTHLKVWRFMNLIHTEVFCRAIPWSRLMLQRTGIVNDLNVGVAERLRALLAGLLLLILILVATNILPWWLLLMMLIIVTTANTGLFKTFLNRKGIFFAIGGILFHQVYYIYSSAAFAWCWLENMVHKI